MKLKLKLSVMALSLVPLTAFGQVQPPRDNTADLVSDIMTISQAGTGTLDEGTYYVRDFALINNALAQWNTLYTLGVVKPLRIIGAVTSLGHRIY